MRAQLRTGEVQHRVDAAWVLLVHSSGDVPAVVDDVVRTVLVDERNFFVGARGGDNVRAACLEELDGDDSDVTVANFYVEADGERLAALAEALEDGLLSPNVGARFALTDAATALQRAVTGRAAGATVLTLDQDSKP